MAAPKGNQFWKARSSHGRKPVFETPAALWDAACEYFEWVDKNPLTAAELVKYQGKYRTAKVPKMRAMTINGLCLFLDIGERTWRDYESKSEDFLRVIKQVENIIRQQKYEGAAADLLNSSIIARDLGLADKRELSGPDGGAIKTEVVSPSDKLADLLDRLAASGE